LQKNTIAEEQKTGDRAWEWGELKSYTFGEALELRTPARGAR
jgi:hypothetical protein